MAMTPPNMGMMPSQDGMMSPDMGQQSREAPTQSMQRDMGLNISEEQFTKALNTLDQSDIEALDTHLTPVVKKAITKLLGSGVGKVIEQLGPNEPTVNVPVSVVASVYPAENIEESIEMMGRDFASKGQQNIPSSPQGGLGGEPMMASPQTNVPPKPMPTGMV